MAETSDGFISTKETRKLIGVTTATLINWAKEGKIGFIIGPSGIRLYNKKDVFDIVGRNSILIHWVNISAIFVCIYILSLPLKS